MFIIDIQEGYFTLDISLVLFDFCVQVCMCVYVMCLYMRFMGMFTHIGKQWLDIHMKTRDGSYVSSSFPILLF